MPALRSRKILWARNSCRGTMQSTMTPLDRQPVNRRSFLLLAAALTVCPAAGAGDSGSRQTVYDFSLVDLDSKVVSLSAYKGKLLLIVNLASQSIFRDQIAALNDLATSYASSGLVVLGIPSSEFGDEELKDLAEMRKYYVDTAHVAFPVFARASLTGPHAIPLYRFLCEAKLGSSGEIHWNFTKFLIDRQGEPLARFEAGDDPADIDFHVTIEQALAGKLKKQRPAKEPESAGDDEDE